MQRPEVAAQHALRINPQSSEGLISLGGIYGEVGREQQAIRTLRRAVALAPNNKTAWQMLGYSYYCAGLNDLAEQAYRRVIELNPTPPHPHWMHARMLLYAGKPHEAELEMWQVVTKNPDQFEVLTYLGGLLYYQGKLDEAEPNLDRAVLLAHDSGDDMPRMMAAFLYASRGHREKIDPRLLRYRPEAGHRRGCRILARRNLCARRPPACPRMAPAHGCSRRCKLSFAESQRGALDRAS